MRSQRDPRLTPLERRELEGMAEKQWQATVLRQARAAPGWRAWHFHDSRRQAGGKLIGDRDAKAFPDTTLIHPEVGMIVAEVKKQTGYRWEDGQREALDDLAATPGIYATWWRPSDIDVIEGILFDLDLSGATWWPDNAPRGWPPPPPA